MRYGSQSIVCIRGKWPYHLSSKGCPAGYSPKLNQFILLTSLKKPICNLDLIGEEGKRGKRIMKWGDRYAIWQRQGWSQVDWVQYDGHPVTQTMSIGEERNPLPTDSNLITNRLTRLGDSINLGRDQRQGQQSKPISARSNEDGVDLHQI